MYKYSRNLNVKILNYEIVDVTWIEAETITEIKNLQK